jgi:RsiW-degrading membrane proteinase PrsW (M82 family)
MLRSLLPKSVSDGAENGSFWRSLGAAISIFVAILASLMLLAETPLTQAWIVGLLGLTVLLPHALWLAAVLHYDGWTPRPWPLVMLAVAWGSLISSTAAIFLETVSAPIANRLGVSDLNTMIMAPLWEEVTKGAFIVLLFVCAQRQLRGAWNGLVYGVLVGTGFGFTEDLVNLMSSLDEIADLVGDYLIRDVFMAHVHPMFTGATGLAAGIAVRQGLPAAKALRWIFYGFLIAVTLHAIFDSAAVVVPFAALILGPIYAAICVIALRQLRRRENVIAQGGSA